MSGDNGGRKKGKSYYTGSGTLWNSYLNKLRGKCRGKNWRNFIHREVLYAKDGISQKALDVLEEHFIKKYKAHYSLGLGGCNILWGTANKFGSGSPTNDLNVRKAISKWWIDFYKSDEGIAFKKKLRDLWSGDIIRGEKNPNYGHRWTDEMKQKASKQKIGMYVGDKNPNYGNHWTDKMKQDLSNKVKDFYANGGVNPMSGKKRITNGIVNKVISSGEPLPYGWRYGMISKHDRKPLSPFIWITDGVNNRRLPKGDEIPNGWRRGAINSFNRKVV